MSRADRAYWDQRWSEAGPAPIMIPSPDPPHFADLLDWFPTSGRALDVACGRGRGTTWLAQRGLCVTAVDVSPVAIEMARRYVSAVGLEGSCAFAVADLDLGIPLDGRFDLVFSYLYWQPHLSQLLVDLATEGGLVAVCHVSEADVGPGEWRIPAGELHRAFTDVANFHVLDAREEDGVARLLGRRRG
jgi:SAM-dependent methyltransferase